MNADKHGSIKAKGKRQKQKVSIRLPTTSHTWFSSFLFAFLLFTFALSSSVSISGPNHCRLLTVDCQLLLSSLFSFSFCLFTFSLSVFISVHPWFQALWF
ncbi:MAG: hypothetical protein ACRD5G_07080 [Candidatus Acidiferrales bacterium]